MLLTWQLPSRTITPCRSRDDFELVCFLFCQNHLFCSNQSSINNDEASGVVVPIPTAPVDGNVFVCAVA